MPFAFETATTEEDARAIVALHEAIAERHRMALPGARPWKVPSLRQVSASIAAPVTILARDGGTLVASLRLDPARGFCGDARFTEAASFVYLFEMMVHPSHQRRGVGRLCLAEAQRWAREHGATAIRLDTNDDAVGAGAFYAACGYRRVVQQAQTIYFELLL